MWSKFRCRIAGLLVAVFLLAACATSTSSPDAAAPQRDSLTDFALEGRFSLRQEDKNYSGRLSWRHAGLINTLLLASPFGQGMAEITTSASGARLKSSDGKVYAAIDTETLTKQVLGYTLPLTQLADWVRGRASGGALELDGQGRPLRLRHQGWRIDYDYESDDPQALPSRIFAEGADGLELRLRIDEWNSPSSGENKP